jgi:trichothecene 3-O-acetyltransferase
VTLDLNRNLELRFAYLGIWAGHNREEDTTSTSSGIHGATTVQATFSLSVSSTGSKGFSHQSQSFCRDRDDANDTIIMEHDFSHLNDVLGSFPMIKRYSFITLFFDLPEATPYEAITSQLTDALTRLNAAFPWLSGRVIYVGEGALRTRTIVAHSTQIPLIVSDLRSSEGTPSMRELSERKFPMHLLDSSWLLPDIALNWASDNDPTTIAPVLLIQANLLPGSGLALSIASNHTTMDMTGLGIVVSWFAKACRGDAFTQTELDQGNQDRRNVIPLLGEDYVPGPELDDSLLKSSPSMTEAANPGPNPAEGCAWSYISLPSSSVAAIKAEASKQNVVPYISTDDALCALLWERIISARTALSSTSTADSSPTSTRSSSLRISDNQPVSKSTFCRTVSLRAHFGLQSAGYTGHLVDCAYTKLPSPSSTNSIPSLQALVGSLRQTLLNTSQLAYHMRAFATTLQRLEDKSRILNGARLDPVKDVVVSSYANLRCCELDFGTILRTPLAARRPKVAPWPGLCYIMPADRGGSVAVGVCLKSREIEWLKGDRVGGWGEVVG